MKIQIRKATEHDLPSILSIYSQRSMDDGNILPIETSKAIFSKIAEYPNYNVYCAVVDERVVGTFALLVMDNLAHMGKPSGVIEDMVVLPDWQRKGVGRAMVNFAYDVCKKAGCYKIMLSSNLERSSAHAFYESLGFKKHGYSYAVEIHDGILPARKWGMK